MTERRVLHMVGFWCDDRPVSEREQQARARAFALLAARGVSPPIQSLEQHPELAGAEPIRYPHPRDLVASHPIPDAPEICRYLRSASMTCQYRGYSYCRFPDGPPDREMGSRELSDGTWVWPEGLPVYVEQFHVQLPDEFVDHMRRHGFTPPPYAHDPDAADYSSARWLAWARRCGARV